MWKFGQSLEEQLASVCAQADILSEILSSLKDRPIYYVDKLVDLRGKEAALRQRIKEKSKTATIRKDN